MCRQAKPIAMNPTAAVTFKGPRTYSRCDQKLFGGKNRAVFVVGEVVRNVEPHSVSSHSLQHRKQQAKEKHAHARQVEANGFILVFI